jgi:hypothetical protein
MKTLLLVATLFMSTALFAQEETEERVLDIQISAQGTSITAIVTEDNNENVLKLDSKKDGKLFMVYSNAKNEPTLTRKYILLNSKDEEIPIFFIGRIIGNLSASLKDLFSKTKVGETYRLFTIATPTDPKEAATVKVRKFLLTKIQIQ